MKWSESAQWFDVYVPVCVGVCMNEREQFPGDINPSILYLSECICVYVCINSLNSTVSLRQRHWLRQFVSLYGITVLGGNNFIFPSPSCRFFLSIKHFVPTLDTGYGCKAGTRLLKFLGLSGSRFWGGAEREGGTVAGSNAEVAGAQRKILSAVTFYYGWGVWCKALPCPTERYIMRNQNKNTNHTNKETQITGLYTLSTDEHKKHSRTYKMVFLLAYLSSLLSFAFHENLWSIKIWSNKFLSGELVCQTDLGTQKVLIGQVFNSYLWRILVQPRGCCRLQDMSCGQKFTDGLWRYLKNILKHFGLDRSGAFLKQVGTRMPEGLYLWQ